MTTISLVLVLLFALSISFILGLWLAKSRCVKIEDKTTIQKDTIIGEPEIEAERKRISDDLHDYLIQQIIALRFQMEITQEGLEEGTQLWNKLDAFKNAISQMVNEARFIIWNISPPELFKNDFLMTLNLMVKNLDGLNSNKIMLIDGKIDFAGVPKNLAIYFFRIVQEVLANAVTHTYGKIIIVVVQQLGNIAEIRISDDGTTKPVYERIVKGRFSGRGGMTIKERAEKIGATIEGDYPGQGIKIFWSLTRVRNHSNAVGKLD